MLAGSTRSRAVLRTGLIAVTFALVAGVSQAPGASASATPPEPGGAEGKVQPRLLTKLEDSAAEPLLVEFAKTPDLSAATRIQDWERRGEAVADTLRTAARSSQAEVIETLEARGVEYHSFWINNSIYVPAGDHATAMAVARQDTVAAVRLPDRVPLEQPRVGSRTTAAAADVEWGVADIKADQVWEQLDVRGEDVVVANIDSGVQFDHPALVASYRGNLGDGTFDHDYNWWDPSKICGFLSSTPCDNRGHGTHTMGTMVGDAGEGNRIGVAPGARWIAAKGCEFDGCSEFALTSAAQWMLAPTDREGQHPDASKRPHIVNNSWSFAGGDDWYQDFVRAWVAAGIFPVFSNGNTGPACNTTGAPGEYAEAYSVGNYSSDGQIAPSSGRGPGTGGERKPNISAPGTNVRSSVPGDAYAVHTGTSMAAPHVAGTVALLWSSSPALVGDIDATRQLLDDTARDQTDLSCGGNGEDNNVYGEGMLDALAVVEAAPRGELGTLAGTVSDAVTGEPVADARLELTGASTRSVLTRQDGTYRIQVTPGTYQVDLRKFGYQTFTRSGVEVTADATTTLDAELTPAEEVTLSGTVRDGSGHGWPLYARVSLPGTDLGTFTDPETGRFSLQAPAGDSYELRVASRYPGYRTHTELVPLGSDTTREIALSVDPETCTAPGYARGSGLSEGFDAGSTPAGWNVVDVLDNGQQWTFDDPGSLGNRTGGQGGFAVVDSDSYGKDGRQDTSLVSPVVDLSAVEEPVLDFATDFKAYWFVRADVDLSVDGGQTWENVWRATTDVRGPRTVHVPLPGAAHQETVRLRFHYYRAGHDWWWQVDDVYLGESTCEAVPAGLVLGHTTRSLTGEPVNGVRVVDDRWPAAEATSVATPDDGRTADGFYWLATPASARRELTASTDEHAPRTLRVAVREDAVTRADFGMRTGRLQVQAKAVEATVSIGHKVTRRVSLVNTGNSELTYELEEHEAAGNNDASTVHDRWSRLDGGGESTPVRRIRADVDPGPRGAGSGATDGTTGTAGPWTLRSPYPSAVKDSLVGYHDGRLYSVGGNLGDGAPLRRSYAYSAAEDTWTPIADLPRGRQKPAGGFVGDRLVVTGGWGEAGFAPDPTTSVYDPATDAWSAAATSPAARAAAGSAVLDGRLYVVGGCSEQCSSGDTQSDVLRYDPDTDQWERLSDYPQRAGWLSCGGVEGKVYCAGGMGPDVDSTATFGYDPEQDTWTRVADLPIDLWGSASAAASGRLVVAGGVTNRSSMITNESFAYDPDTDEWDTLPGSHFALYRSAGGCGFYKVGGSDGTFRGDRGVEQLPGLDGCSPWADFGWLEAKKSDGRIKPGHRTKVKVTLDARRITRPGTYRAQLVIDEDTPFRGASIPVTMVVTR